jgi:hypothetical protein
MIHPALKLITKRRTKGERFFISQFKARTIDQSNGELEIRTEIWFKSNYIVDKVNIMRRISEMK